jgi:hypothetical protein
VAGADVTQRQTAGSSGAPMVKLTGAEFSILVPAEGNGPRYA